MINVGIDWAEDSHQVCILDNEGTMLDEFVIRDGAAGTGRLHEHIAYHVDEPRSEWRRLGEPQHDNTPESSTWLRRLPTPIARTLHRSRLRWTPD